MELLSSLSASSLFTRCCREENITVLDNGKISYKTERNVYIKRACLQQFNQVAFLFHMVININQLTQKIALSNFGRK